MMNKLLAASALGFGLLVAGSAAAQKVVPSQSEITFVSRQMGVPVDGRFRKFDAQVSFDPKNPEAAKIGFSIDLGSVSIGGAETEAELARADWFNTKAFPQATFHSTRARASGAGKFEVAGKLTLKGVSREVLVPVVLAQAGPVTIATGGFTLKRLEFKIGEGDWKDTSMVADEVQVKFKLSLTGVAPL